MDYVTAISTSQKWWYKCTGNFGGYGFVPLWILSYGSTVTPGPLPAGWR